jgi:FKBP-type peptidyl-prolyl cis-trans isomerase SlyD
MMVEQEMPQIVENDIVVTMKYTLTVEGELIDSSEDSGITEFIQGRGQVIPGIERHLIGMKIGEAKSIRVKPLEGYGERDPEMVVEIKRSEFPPEIPLVPGVEVEMEDEEGEYLEAIVVSVGNDTVTLDFNDPLAGKDLEFNITIVDLRHPTKGEMECGYVHCDECQDLDCSGEEDCL